MIKTLKADVIVVGAGTAGCYFAWRMGGAGYRVIILEKRALKTLGAHIDVFHMEDAGFREFDIPLPGKKELLHHEESFYSWSPDLAVKQEIRFPFYVMHKPSFQQRMHGYARKSGARIFEKALVTGVIIENGFITGVRGTMGKQAFEARGKIIADASGINGAVRTLLPDGFGVENDPVKDEHKFFVCLEMRDRTGEGYPTGSNSYILHKAFWNLGHGKGSILGIGQPLSYANAWRKHLEWREEYFGNPGRVRKRTQGSVPFRRPPWSLVGNGFMAMGDAACQNKFFSGEGVISGFAAARIASDAAIKALSGGDVSREGLWEYNVRYFRGQGALFAGGLAQLPAAAELSRDDVNYLFKNNVIFSAPDFEELNATYEIKMSIAKTLAVAGKLLSGVVTGKFSFAGLRKLLASSAKGAGVKGHYLKFPDDPALFDAWVRKAGKLWGEA